MHRSTTTFLHELIKKPQGNINHMLSSAHAGTLVMTLCFFLELL